MPAERTARPQARLVSPGYRAQEILVRLALGVVLGALARGVSHLPVDASTHLGLELICGGALVAGIIYGWAGAIGFWAGEIGLHYLLFGRAARLEMLVPILVLGLSGYACFRWAPRVDRRLPDLRSYLTMLFGASVAAWPAAALTVAVVFGSLSWSAIALWYAAILATIALLAPAALQFWPQSLWRWREPIPGEGVPAASARHAAGIRVRDSSGSLPIVRRPTTWRDVLVVVASVLAIHLLVLRASAGAPLNHWLFLLYSLPMLFSAYRGGLRGGLLAGTLVGLSLLSSELPTGPAGDWHLGTVELQAGVLLFSLFGAVGGAVRDHERNLTRQLERSNRALRQDLERVLAALRSAMEAKDQYTEGHLRRVCEFAVEVGRRMDVSPHELELLEIASLLHDVGKIGIADAILRKPGPLDGRERELMQRHPDIGARILENVEGLKEAAEMVRHHQERFDGKTTGTFPGYPRGLRRDEIPLGARIIAVVDAFDAMMSDRPYRDAIGLELAKKSLRDESGSQFDPLVVATFLALLEERQWADSEAREREATMVRTHADLAYFDSDERLG